MTRFTVLLALLLAAPAPPDQAAVARTVRTILKEVSEARGLPMRRPVNVEFEDKDQVRGYLRGQLSQDGAQEKLDLQGRLFMRLGMYPRTDRFTGELEDLLVSQVGGYYDPDRDVFVVAQWIDLELQKPVMAHELLHALQDQWFHLSDYINEVVDRGDAAMARQAVLEGDGMAAMLDYSLKPQGLDFTKIGDVVGMTQLGMTMAAGSEYAFPPETPQLLKDLLLFPYAYGTAFLQARKRHASWSEMNRIYRDPPESTEQILHPEKYWCERDHPVKVELPPVPEGMHLGAPVYEDTFGQYLIYLWLKTVLSGEVSVRASDGWGGDRIALYGKPGAEAVSLATEWDTTADAGEFGQAAALALGGDNPGTFEGKLGKATVTIDGRACLIFVYPPPD